jgi:hypothetical protein
VATFSLFAIEKMNQLEATASSQVGTEYLGSDKAGKTPTNCIDFVVKVLGYAYEKIGQTPVANEVQRLAVKGTQLADFLVSKRHWHAHYWNPDVRFPSDGDSEHPASYHTAVKFTKYYGIQLSGAIINYRLTPGHGLRTASTAALARFNLVPFAFGITYGGRHTFLVSNGIVHEAHWSGIGDSLYGRTNFAAYKGRAAFLSGIVVVPKETSFRSDPLK